jgi:tetratricopeptide (TPR) repeat protein
MVTSCSKKSVKMGEEVESATPAPEQVKPEKPQETAESVTMPDTESARRAGAERGARLRDQQQEERLQEEVRLFESEPIYFDFDETVLKPAARTILTKKAAWLRLNPQFSVRIEGYCDERGTSEYNLALGERRADVALMRGDYRAGISLHEALLAEQSQNALALYHLGYAYGQIGRHTLEVQYYERAISLGFRSDQIYFNLAMAYGEMGQQETSIGAIKKALEINPDNADYHFELALA